MDSAAASGTRRDAHRCLAHAFSYARASLFYSLLRLHRCVLSKQTHTGFFSSRSRCSRSFACVSRRQSSLSGGGGVLPSDPRLRSSRSSRSRSHMLDTSIVVLNSISVAMSCSTKAFVRRVIKRVVVVHSAITFITSSRHSFDRVIR